MSSNRKASDQELRAPSSSLEEYPRYSAGRMSQKNAVMHSWMTWRLRLPCCRCSVSSVSATVCTSWIDAGYARWDGSSSSWSFWRKAARRGWSSLLPSESFLGSLPPKWEIPLPTARRAEPTLLALTGCPLRPILRYRRPNTRR